ncbi:MAG: 30S ribosome-binding factor RbfA [Porticoccaceae bacterium]|jgi:ribosome-binding factor A|nr:30S ribosome-binding factor RbfA [Porticoccaceae bacterium]
MHDFSRAERVGDTIQRQLANLIQQEIRDPRVGMVNVNAVRVSSDLSNARVFVTFVDRSDQAQIKQSIEALNNAAGFLRTQLHRQMTLRVVPKLRFEYDESVRRAAQMTDLIDSALEADRKLSGSESIPEADSSDDPPSE